MTAPIASSATPTQPAHAHPALLALRQLPTEAVSKAAQELAPQVENIRHLYNEASDNPLDRSHDAVITTAVVTFEDNAAVAQLTVGSRQFQSKDGPVQDAVEVGVRFAGADLTKLLEMAALNARRAAPQQPIERVTLPELPATWAHRSLAALGGGAAAAGTAYWLGGVTLAAASPLLLPLVVGAGLAAGAYGAWKPQHGMGLFAAAAAGLAAAALSPYAAPAGAALGWFAGKAFSRDLSLEQLPYADFARSPVKGTVTAIDRDARGIYVEVTPVGGTPVRTYELGAVLDTLRVGQGVQRGAYLGRWSFAQAAA